MDVAAELGGASALVNNASTLGTSPLPTLADLDTATYLAHPPGQPVAPMALTAALLPQLRPHGGVVLNLSSDASVEAYETWGGYGSSKAGLDHATRVLAAEEPALRVYAVDPGDMRTQMHQDAFPGEDISDRPEPTVAVPALLRLLEGSLPSGRYRASELLADDLADARAGVRVSAAATERGSCCRPAARRPRRQRPGAWPATRSGWPWSPRNGPTTGRRASSRCGWSPATCSS